MAYNMNSQNPSQWQALIDAINSGGGGESSPIVEALGVIATAIGGINTQASGISLTPPSGMTATNVQAGINELDTRIKNDEYRNILLGVNMSGGQSSNFNTQENISKFSNLMFVMSIGNVVLSTTIYDKTFFISGDMVRVHWFDTVNLYYFDCVYVNDNTVTVIASFPAGANLQFRLIGFN